jgi:hypothetical protein
MDLGSRVADLGAALLRMAAEFSGDVNEQHYLAHWALVHIIFNDPTLERMRLEEEDLLRRALWIADLEARGASAYVLAGREGGSAAFLIDRQRAAELSDALAAPPRLVERKAR